MPIAFNHRLSAWTGRPSWTCRVSLIQVDGRPVLPILLSSWVGSGHTLLRLAPSVGSEVRGGCEVPAAVLALVHQGLQGRGTLPPHRVKT